MSIHAFLKKDDCIKQVPLLFVLMSRRQKLDYVLVFKALLEHIAPEEVQVEWFMLDFEAATWQAIREVFHNVLIRGCVFHWSQSVYRMILRLGLSTSYHAGGDAYEFLKKVLSLPYLPVEHILGAFVSLRGLASQTSTPASDQFLQYVANTWIYGTMWKPENWCVFREQVRTNNDVEGWHRGLNTRASGTSLAFYVLVPLLKTEAEYVSITVRLVSSQLITRNQRKQYKTLHGRLQSAWDRYEEEDTYTTSKLLREVSRISGLGPNPATASAGPADVSE